MFKLCQQRRKVLCRALGFGIVAGIIVFVYSAYHYRLDWTGFVEGATTERSTESKTETSPIEKFTKITKDQSAKTLWDWLELLIVPVLIAGFGLWFQSEQDKRERAIAQINSAEEAIEAYLKSMADILLNEELKKELFPNRSKVILRVSIEDKEDKDNSVRDIARALTIAILRRLEGVRRLESDRRYQDVILHFLRDAELHKFILKKAHLSEMDLSGTSLWDVDLSGASLRETDLSEANLNQAILSEAVLKGADLEGAVLKGAKNLTPKQIKSAHNWQQAIYIGEFKKEKKIWEAIEPQNTNFIKDLENNESLDPEKPFNWSI